MSQQIHPQSDDVIRRLAKWGEGQPLVRAMLLTSNRANPHAHVDALSDYDVILVVSDIYPFVDDKRWLGDFGQVLVVYWDPIHPAPGYAIEQSGNVTQYADGLRIDFTLWPVELLREIIVAPTPFAELDNGYVVLLDKDHLTDGLPAPTYAAYIPRKPSEAEFQTWVNDFFSDVAYVPKCLVRGDLFPLKWCLDYDMKHVYLRQMLEWRVQLDHDWSMPTGALGKGLKRLLLASIWSQLQETYAGAGVEENWDALFKTIALFRQVATEVAEGLGYAYPLELDQRVTAYAREIRDRT